MRAASAIPACQPSSRRRSAAGQCPRAARGMLHMQQRVTGRTAPPRPAGTRRRAANRPPADSPVLTNSAAIPRADADVRVDDRGTARPNDGDPPHPGVAGDAPGSRSAPRPGRERRPVAGVAPSRPQVFESLVHYCLLHHPQSCGCVHSPDLRGREFEEAAADESQGTDGRPGTGREEDGTPRAGPERPGTHGLRKVVSSYRQRAERRLGLPMDVSRVRTFTRASSRGQLL